VTTDTVPETVLLPALFDKPLVATFEQEPASSDAPGLRRGTRARAAIFFGSMQNPNFLVSQQILGAYVQDSWSPNRRLTLQAGAC